MADDSAGVASSELDDDDDDDVVVPSSVAYRDFHGTDDVASHLCADGTVRDGAGEDGKTAVRNHRLMDKLLDCDTLICYQLLYTI